MSAASGTPEPLSVERVLDVGGWNPRYARVVGLASWNGHAIAVVDGDGSGRELDIEQWAFNETHSFWTGGPSSGAGSLADFPSFIRGGWEGHYVFAVGKAEPNSTVRLLQGDAVVTVAASAYGIWAYLAPDGQPLTLVSPK
jgi:hypothetical protein